MATSIPPNKVSSIFLGSGLLLAFLSGCYTNARDVSTQPEYRQLVLQTYQTKTDLYLCLSSNNPTPFLGINDGQAGFRARTLPQFVRRSEIGRKFPNGVILDVVPVGAKFFARSIIYDSQPTGERVWFEGELIYPGKSVRQVRALFIQSNVDGRDGRLPEIDPTLAELIK